MDILKHHLQGIHSLRDDYQAKDLPPLLCTCLALLIFSCDAPEAPKSLFNTQEVSQISGEESNTLTGGENEQAMVEFIPSLEGAWVHYSQVSTCVDIGSSLEQFNRSLYTVQVVMSDHGALTEVWEACEIDLTPVISVRARVPEALRGRVYPIETTGALVVGQPPSQRYISAPLAEIWGIEMSAPLIDPMPTTPEDDRIYDMDEDGQVGVTLEIGDACLAYMTQRRITSFHGEFTAPDTIEGEALSVTEQYIIDASAPICKTSYQTRSNPSRSHFERIRIDGRGGSINLDLDGDGAVSCEELSIGRDALFIERLVITELDQESCRR